MLRQLHLLQAEWEQFTQTRDEPAYQKLYTHYYHYLFFIGSKRGFATARVKDCINDIFLHVWENAAQMRQVASYHNYLVTAFLRKLVRKERFAAEAAIELELAVDMLQEPSVEAAYIQTQVKHGLPHLLEGYLNGLPTRQRTMIYQKFYLGLSYAEIAAANQVSVNTVYNTVYQALEKLKNQLGSRADDWLDLALLMLLYGIGQL